MNNAKAFGAVLAGIRKEQGFPSAHQFFKSIGGSKSLGLAFVSYWDIERGKKLPRSWRLKAILSALGIVQQSPKAKELVRAYFRALSGSDELVQILAAPAAAGAHLPVTELGEVATQKALEQMRVNLTLEQWKLCSRDHTTCICQYFLFNTAGWVPMRELSAATGFRPEAVRKAVKALAAGGLVKISGDRVQCPFAEKLVAVLPTTPATAGIRSALSAHLEKWLKSCRRIDGDGKRITVRMSKANMDGYLQYLQKAVNLAGIYDNSAEDRRDSAVYIIDSSVVRIFPRNLPG